LDSLNISYLTIYFILLFFFLYIKKVPNWDFCFCGDADIAIGSSLVKINYSFTSLVDFSKSTKYSIFL
jgi:hypothetical protein